MFLYSRVYSISSEKNSEPAIMVRGNIITVKTVKLHKCTCNYIIGCEECCGEQMGTQKHYVCMDGFS